MPRRKEALRTLTSEEIVEIAKRRPINAHDKCAASLPMGEVVGLDGNRAIRAQTVCPTCGKTFVTFPDNVKWFELLDQKTDQK